ncbi:MAG: ATP-binding protein [Atopobiaceae bacterium]|jgi:signal transduction histidine kinase/CheY-like chemotaxis protein/PAS domain-containing protein|nr:ATP-binding protein [Atopobiaceae bacterium]
MHITWRRVAPVLIGLLIVSGLVAGVVTSAWSARQASESKAEAVLTDSAHEQARSLAQTFDGQFQVLEALSASVGQMDTSDISAISSLFDAASKDMNVGSLVFIGPDGVSLVGVNAGVDTSDVSSTQAALAGNRGMAYVVGRASGEPGVVLSVPCYRDGQVVGIVSGMYYRENLSADLSGTAYAGESISFLASSDGTIIVPSSSSLFVNDDDNAFNFMGSDAVSFKDGDSLEEMEASLQAGKETVVRYTYNGSDRFTIYTPLTGTGLPGNDWFVANEIDASSYAADVSKAQGEALRSMFVFGIFLVGAFALFMRYDYVIRRHQREDASVIAERDRQYEIVLKQGGKHVYRYDVATGAGTHVSEVNPFSEAPVREHMVETMLSEGHVAPDQADAYRDFFHRIDQGEPFQTTRFKLHTVDGRWVWYQEDATTVFDDAGKPSYAIISYWDITDQLEAEGRYAKAVAYRELAERSTVASFHLDVTSDSVDDGVSEYDDLLALGSDGTVTGLMAGIEASIPNGGLRAIFHERFSREAMVAAFGEGRNDIDLEHPILAGAVSGWFHTTVHLLPNPQTGDIEGFAYGIDLTEEHQTEQVLQTLASNDYDRVILVDRTRGSYHAFFSKSDEDGARMGGVSFDGDMRSFVRAMIHPDDRERVAASLMLATMGARADHEGTFDVSARLVMDGTVRNKLYRVSSLGIDKGHLVVSRIDVTDSVSRLQAALDTAEQASRAKGDFLSRMSHDIRTPMNAVMNLTRMMRDELDDKPALTSDLDRMEASSEFLLSLINDVLDISHIESGTFELTPSVYGFHEFVEYMEGVIVPLCREKGLEFVWEKGSTSVDLYVDKTRFNQVFFNLLSNAVKFTPKGGRVSFVVRDNVVENGILTCNFEVNDTGIGMTREFQRNMFDSFTRADATGAYQGTGLGLAITKAIVDKMGGTISVTSAPGRGTSIMVHLSMALATPEQVAQESARLHASSPEHLQVLAGRRVLLCEDSNVNALITRRLLAKVGVEVEVAQNGQVGVDLFQGHDPGHYDAILMDVRMPVMDGLEATRTIRSLARDDAKAIPIIAMTADAFSEDQERTIASGMNAHLSKPVVPEDLYRTLAEACAPRR